MNVPPQVVSARADTDAFVTNTLTVLRRGYDELRDMCLLPANSPGGRGSLSASVSCACIDLVWRGSGPPAVSASLVLRKLPTTLPALYADVSVPELPLLMCFGCVGFCKDVRGSPIELLVSSLSESCVGNGRR